MVGESAGWLVEVPAPIGDFGLPKGFSDLHSAVQYVTLFSGLLDNK